MVGWYMLFDPTCIITTCQQERNPRLWQDERKVLGWQLADCLPPSWIALRLVQIPSAMS